MKNIYGEDTRQSGRSLFMFPENYVVIDTETTGLSPANCEIIEISGIRVKDNVITDTFSSLVRPQKEIPAFVQNLTGITNEMVSAAPEINSVLYDFLKFIGNGILVGHNIIFDLNFLRFHCNKILELDFDNDYIDTLRLSRKLVREIDNHKLSTLADHFGVVQESAHRALDDCITTNQISLKLCELNNQNEAAFIQLFDNVSNVLEGKTVVFKGTTTLCSYNAYSKICRKAGGRASKIFFEDETDYVVFGKKTYLKYLRGDYSEDMYKADRLSSCGKLEILSEVDFIRMLDVPLPASIEISPIKTKRYRYHSSIDIKSMCAETNDFDETHPLFGKVCVFTGELDRMSRKEAMQAVLNLGGEIGSGITRKTNFLILGCNDYCKAIKDGKSSKHKKAEEYQLKGFDIKIIDEDLFYTMLDD